MPVGFRVIRRSSRPDAALLKGFAALHTADLSDAMNRSGTMDRGIQPVFSPIKRVVGPAVTISAPTGAFNMVKIGMEQTQASDVLAGLVADGAVRDASEIQQDGLPTFARGITTVMGPIDGPGEVNVPIACGGVVVNPGDIIVADADGIVVIRPSEAEEVLVETARLEATHDAVQPILLRGEVTNIAKIERALRDQGCTFVDG